MEKSFRNFVLFLLLLAAVPVCGGPTPRATVQSFLIAARAGNTDGVKKCLNNGNELGKPDAKGIAAMRLMFQGAKITQVEKVNYLALY